MMQTAVELAKQQMGGPCYWCQDDEKPTRAYKIITIGRSVMNVLALCDKCRDYINGVTSKTNYHLVLFD
jgi:hypothetical protein